jgi:hypothetical protein
MNHKQRIECFEKNIQECRKIWEAKGIEYANSDIDANANFKSDEEIGVSQIKSVSVFMNKHYRSIRSYVQKGEVKSNEPIEGRLHDLINYSLIMLSIIEDERSRAIGEAEGNVREGSVRFDD